MTRTGAATSGVEFALYASVFANDGWFPPRSAFDHVLSGLDAAIPQESRAS
jgi:hypothetical protein